MCMMIIMIVPTVNSYYPEPTGLIFSKVYSSDGKGISDRPVIADEQVLAALEKSHIWRRWLGASKRLSASNRQSALPGAS